ncbi:putative N-acetyltransferase C9.02c [Psilocybe cubensis]|uniref:N-acetyltransferase C9.02c n=1 Tax=Psilocybe cubensis TaxID=181762 RepID=A0ACB8GL70_PSICU|nr:putative N-acetyltransferase C9.02c [Psilocybe cubensis]KAH9475961.1 putative N-acetyltransferase C9.02c [Psilocybe cubensis]
MALIFDYVPSYDIPAALEIEKQGYPEDEAGTESSFRLRQSQAGNLFLGAYEPTSGSERRLIGYICSTLSPSPTLSHDSMSTHVPNSSSVCIHSVCVSPSHQRRGIGLSLLKEYITRLEKARAGGYANYRRVLLITHENLRDFYEKAGFEWLGKSEVVHGSRPWFEMRRELHSAQGVIETPVKTAKENAIPPGILEALQRPKDVFPSSKLVSDFPNGLPELIEPDEKNPGTSFNKYDLICPRNGCGSVILKRGGGKWTERESVQLEPEGYSQPELPPLPIPPETAQWWLITPSILQFENIGRTHSVHPLSEGGRERSRIIGASRPEAPIFAFAHNQTDNMRETA